MRTTGTISRGVPEEGRAVGRRPRRPRTAGLSQSALRIRRQSQEIWGGDRLVEIVGRSSPIEKLLGKLEKLARYHEPVLILGESGVGKESLAQALYLLGQRARKPFVSVNCPQFQEGNLTVSELFGHKKGTFTGAVADRKGCFEIADQGVIFLDEIGDLHMSAQLMLLRALSTGQFQPLGSNDSRTVNVRVVAATNCPLNKLASGGQFRRDLLFRLRNFQLDIPPLRERGDDWRLLLEHFLRLLQQRYGVAKRFSATSLKLLEGYAWPGNVRELKSLTTTGYALCDGDVVEPQDFIDCLEPTGCTTNHLEVLFDHLRSRQGSFWELVQEPYLDRDLNRREVQELIARGLAMSQGSYRRLLQLWRIPTSQYQKFMDFLRHHRLKPEAFGP